MWYTFGRLKLESAFMAQLLTIYNSRKKNRKIIYANEKLRRRDKCIQSKSEASVH